MYRRLSLILLTIFLLVGCDSNQPSNAVPPAKDIWLPDPDENVGQMSAIKVISPDNIWAVGSTGIDRYESRPQSSVRGMIIHWDGASWEIKSSISDILANNVLNDVDASSSNDVWVIGYKKAIYRGSTVIKNGEALILRWDGTNWNRITLPDNLANLGKPTAVVASAPDDVWIAGRTLIRWNGKEWSEVALPAGIETISDMDAISPTDIWATAGYSIIHWNGSEWRILYTSQEPSPRPPAYSLRPSFDQISAAVTNDVWVVGGASMITNCGVSYRYLYHWDGSQLNKMAGIGWGFSCGGQGPSGERIQDLHAAAPDRVWLLSLTHDRTPDYAHITTQEIILWDGSTFHLYTCPTQGAVIPNQPQATNFTFNRIVEVSPNELWGLGGYTIPWDPTSTQPEDTRRAKERGWIRQIYTGDCPPTGPIPTRTPEPELPAYPTHTAIQSTWPPGVPTERPTIPLPLPSGVATAPFPLPSIAPPIPETP